MTAPFAFVPLSRTLPYWPAELFGPPGGILDYVGITHFKIESLPDSLGMTGKLAYLKELAFPVPALEGVTLAFLSNGSFTEIEIEADLAPSFKVTLKDLGAQLRIKSDLLKPVEKKGDDWEVLTEIDGSTKPLTIELGAIDVSVDGEGDIEVTADDSGFTIDPIQIGDTGIVLTIDELKLSHNADTGKIDGIELKKAEIHIPGNTSGFAVALTDTKIVSSGFSGTIEASFGTSGISTKLFGANLTLKCLELSFKQNIPVSTSIVGEILLPFFDEALPVEVGLTSDGDLTIGVSGGIGELDKPGLLKVELEVLEIEITDGKPLFTLSGALTPLIGSLDWPTFEVEKLTIDHKGHIDVDGGWFNLANQEPLDFKGFTVQITKFGLGHTDDGGQWVGVSGLVNLIKGVQGSASVEGLRIVWYEDGTKKITLNGIGIEMTISEVLYLKGALSFKSNPGFYRFDGALTLALDTPQLVIDSRMTIGRMLEDPNNANSKKIPFGALYGDMELPTGLPIATTGAGLFSFSLFLALNMAPGRDPDQKWFGKNESPLGWYHEPDIGVFDTRKWKPRKGTKAVGAGLGVGTFSDGAFTFYAKALAILSFPGPFMIEGRGQIVKQRKAMSSTDDPLFRAVAIFDRESGEYTFGLDAFYMYGETDGEVIDIRASIEAYYNKSDPTLWHVYFGQKPRDRRVMASVISLFTAESYFMIDAQSLQMGIWVGFDEEWKLGPLKVELDAFISSDAVLSFAPVHFEAAIWMHGGIELSAFGVGLGIACDARLEGEVNDPFHVLGSLEVALELPFPLKDIKESITLEWGPEPTLPPVPIVLKDVAIEHLKSTAVWPLAWGGALGPSFDDGYGFLGTEIPFTKDAAAIPVVPIDGRPSIAFAHSVHDDAQVGINGLMPNPAWELIGDPQSGTAKVKVRYAVTSIVLQKFIDGGWTGVAGAGSEATGLPKLFGSWAPVNASSGVPGAVEQSRLLLWSRSGFDHMRKTGPEWIDWFKANHQDYPCVQSPDWECYEFSRYSLGTVGTYDPDYKLTALDHMDKPTLQFMSPLGLKVEDHPPEAGSGSPVHGLQGTNGDAPSASAPPPPILIILPTDPKIKSMRVRVYSSGTHGTVHAVFGTPEVEQQLFASTSGKGGYEDLLLQSAHGIMYVYLSADHHNVDGYFAVIEVCLSEFDNASELEFASSHLKASTAHWADQGEVLEPNTDYRLQIITTARALGHNPEMRDQETFAYFRTGAPPAIKPTPEIPNAPNVPTQGGPVDPTTTPTTSKFFGWDSSGQKVIDGDNKIGQDGADGLDDLTLYVRQTIPPTLGADRDAPLMPRPVFRAYDTGVMFNESYVDLLYRMAGRDLRIQIGDGNAEPVRQNDGRALSFENAWGVTTEYGLSELDQSWLDYVDPACHPIPISSIPLNQKLDTTATPLLLKPNARYRVRLAPLLMMERWHESRYSDGAAATPSAPLGAWSVADAASHWTVGNLDPATACITQTGSGAECRLIYTAGGANAWTGYRFSVGMRFDSALHIGAYINYQDTKHFIRFNMDRSSSKRTLALGHTLPSGSAIVDVLAEDVAPSALTSTDEYRLEIECVGDRIIVAIDDVACFDVDVAKMVDVPRSGAIGLWSNNGAGATFTDIQVECFGASTPTAYAFEFATSAFVNFAHLVHSRRTPVWTYDVSEDNAAIAAATSKAAIDQSTPPSNPEAAEYEALRALWLDPGIADLPGSQNPLDPLGFEVNKIERNSKTVGWLIRSREPLDWARATFELRRTGQKAPSSLVLGPAKVIGARLNAPTPDEEVIDILFHEGIDTEGWRLEQRAFTLPTGATKLPTIPLDDPLSTWSTLFEFSRIACFAGVTLRLGSGTSTLLPPDHTWTTLSRVTGGSAGSIDLSPLGADLRLVDKGGHLITATRILPRSTFAPNREPVRFLRKLDSTAVLVLPQTGYEFKPGSYVLDLRFQRDISSTAPERMVLSQAGATGEERAWIPLY